MQAKTKKKLKIIFILLILCNILRLHEHNVNSYIDSYLEYGDNKSIIIYGGNNSTIISRELRVLRKTFCLRKCYAIEEVYLNSGGENVERIAININKIYEVYRGADRYSVISDRAVGRFHVIADSWDIIDNSMTEIEQVPTRRYNDQIYSTYNFNIQKSKRYDVEKIYIGSKVPDKWDFGCVNQDMDFPYIFKVYGFVNSMEVTHVLDVILTKNDVTVTRIAQPEGYEYVYNISFEAMLETELTQHYGLYYKDNVLIDLYNNKDYFYCAMLDFVNNVFADSLDGVFIFQYKL